MQPTTTTTELTDAHNAIQTRIDQRDHHSAHIWARDAERIELYLNGDVAISDNKGCIGYVIGDDGIHHKVYRNID